MTVNYALAVISWYENLPKKEQPPRAIWWSDSLLDEWFQNVQDSRDTRSGGTTSAYDKADDAPMTDNELADEFRQRM